jgi:hypothetical protein
MSRVKPRRGRWGPRKDRGVTIAWEMEREWMGGVPRGTGNGGMEAEAKGLRSQHGKGGGGAGEKKRRKNLPSTMWALRWSWACSLRVADSSPGCSADLRRALSWTNSGPGSNTPMCWCLRKADSHRGSVAVAKSWRDVRAPLSWADSESVICHT